MFLLSLAAGTIGRCNTLVSKINASLFHTLNIGKKVSISSSTHIQNQKEKGNHDRLVYVRISTLKKSVFSAMYLKLPSVSGGRITTETRPWFGLRG